MKKKGKKPVAVSERIIKLSIIPKNKDGSNKKNACWEFTGCKNNAGYGMINVDSVQKMQLAHRVMGIEHGLNKEQEIQHTCLNRLCVNPHHLVNGDAKSRTNRMEKASVFRPFKSREFMYRTCEVCQKTDYLPHYKRKHSQCQNNSEHK